MARITDPNKLEKIKRVTMEMMAENGYKDMAVSKIAKKAEVSVGYLYRHFDGKIDLINTLSNEYFEMFNSQLNASISSDSSLKDVVHLYISTLIDLALDDPVPIMFLSSLVSDRSFHKEKANGDPIIKLEELAKRIIANRTKTGEMRKDLEVADFVLIFVELPLNYVYMRLVNALDSTKLQKSDVSKLTEIIINALS